MQMLKPMLMFAAVRFLNEVSAQMVAPHTDFAGKRVDGGPDSNGPG